jgi:hypothetical protein
MAVNWTNVTTWTGILQTANTNSGSWFWTFILYGLFFIFLILFSGLGLESSVLISSFVALVIGLFLVYADLVAFQWILTFVGLILIMFMYIAWTSKKY